MLINLRNALMSGRRLPYDAEVKFLESTGTQWINTGVNGAADLYYSLTIQPTYSSGDRKYFGSYPSGLTLAQLNGNWRFLERNWILSSVAVDSTTASVVERRSDGLYVNGAKVADIWDGARASTGLILFGQRTDSGVSLSYCRVYACKIYLGAVLVRDFIPVRKGTVGYLYDRVSGRLFGNAGTGDFQYGQDVVPVEYIESHGAEWINSGINIDTGTDTVQGDVLFLPDTASGYKYYFGTYGTPIGESALTYYALAKVTNTTGIIIYIPSTASNGYSTVSVGNIDESWHTVQMGPSGLYFDGVDKTGGVVQRTVAFGVPFALFAGIYANDGRPRNYCKARLRHLQISRNNTLVRSFRSVRVGTEGAMMDTLTRRIYRNQGTGAFGYGNDLKYPIPAS